MTKTWERLNLITNLVVVIAIVALIVRPNGVLSQWWQARSDAIQTRKTISALWPELSTRYAQRLGSQTGELALLEFADYQCPFCATVHHTITKLLEATPDLAVGFVHFPLTRIHRQADGAARASICAEKQGHFLEMHNYLFSHDDWQEGDNWVSHAINVGVPDTVEFSRCLTAADTERRLRRDRDVAEQLGVKATPTFVSKHNMVSGALELDQLTALIR